MAITASHLKIVIRGLLQSQRVQVVQWYQPLGAAFLTATPEAVGEAFWNDIKTLWRAALAPSVNALTTSIFVSEPGAAGAYGEYPIPSGEQQGTRTVGTETDFLPPYVAVAVRQTVGTRTTRPGQKRFWGWRELDNSNGAVGSAALTVVGNLMVKFVNEITLGAPVATGTLVPEVVRYDPGTKSVVASQGVSGFIINTNLSTQNSRKFGRGE